MKNNFPELHTPGLLLRQFKDDDLENVFRGLSDPDVVRYYGVSYITLQETKQQLKFFNDLEENGTGLWWAICNKENTNFYGAGGINNLNAETRKAELGFWLYPQYWKQGIIQEALPVICNYCFAVLGLEQLEGLVEAENIASIKSLERLGFNHVHTIFNAEIKNGKSIDLEIYVLTRGGHSKTL